MVKNIQNYPVGKVCKQYVPRRGPIKCSTWSGSKLFDTLMIAMKDIFKNVDFLKKKLADEKKMQNYGVGKELRWMVDYPQKQTIKHKSASLKYLLLSE